MRARHDAQERHAWLGTTRAGARHGAQERLAWLRTTRAGARARATVHKNAMIGDNSRGRARATVHENTMIEDVLSFYVFYIIFGNGKKQNGCEMGRIGSCRVLVKANCTSILVFCRMGMVPRPESYKKSKNDVVLSVYVFILFSKIKKCKMGVKWVG